MKFPTRTLWTPALLLPALVFAEGTKSTPEAAQPLASEGLVRVDADVVRGAFDRERWQEALAVDDLDQRERNFDELVRLARRDPDVRRALDEWAAGADPGLAWTARLALREVRPQSGLFRTDGPFSRRGFDSRFGDLHERLRELETMFDDLGRGHGLWVDPDFDPDAMTPPFAWTPQGPGGPGGGAQQESRSYSIEIGPDGARVDVREEVDGREDVRTYEGDSLEDLFEANPELRERIRLRTGGAELWQDPLAGLRRRGLLRGDPMLPRTDMLGIEYEAPSAARADALGLEPGVGLVVLRTVPGTIAHILGIQRGDVLTELNDNVLYSGDDVSRVLRERQPEADVAVKLIDARGQERTLTWHPTPPSAIEPRPLRRVPETDETR